MKVGDYVRTKYGIGKIDELRDFIGTFEIHLDSNKGRIHNVTDNTYWNTIEDIIAKPSSNIIDLIEYMDLLELEHPVKLYDTDTTIGLFNPVRCDGFTTFEDGTHCIILNMDYIVDIKDLKIKSVLTHEQFDEIKYEVR